MIELFQQWALGRNRRGKPRPAVNWYICHRMSKLVDYAGVVGNELVDAMFPIEDRVDRETDDLVALNQLCDVGFWQAMNLIYADGIGDGGEVHSMCEARQKLLRSMASFMLFQSEHFRNHSDQALTRDDLWVITREIYGVITEHGMDIFNLTHGGVVGNEMYLLHQRGKQNNEGSMGELDNE